MKVSSILDDSLSQENTKNDKSKELDDIIICLEYAINDINKGQNKFYIIEELENILTKLKKYSKNTEEEKSLQNDSNIRESKRDLLKPPKSGIATIDLTKNLKARYSNSSFRQKRNNSQDFSKSYSLNISSRKIKQSNFTNYKTKESLKRSLNTSFSNESESIRNRHSLSLTRYDGSRINGKKEGKGIYYYPNGCRYEGYFKNDKKNGIGIYYYTNGDRYEGNFKEGNYEGKGIFYFNNGDRYEGNFEINKYSGKGIYYYHNGDYFDGYWIDDKKNGEGIYYCKNGDKIIGKYYNGKPYGTHIKHCLNGKTLIINY